MILVSTHHTPGTNMPQIKDEKIGIGYKFLLFQWNWLFKLLQRFCCPTLDLRSLCSHHSSLITRYQSEMCIECKNSPDGNKERPKFGGHQGGLGREFDWRMNSAVSVSPLQTSILQQSTSNHILSGYPAHNRRLPTTTEEKSPLYSCWIVIIIQVWNFKTFLAVNTRISSGVIWCID